MGRPSKLTATVEERLLEARSLGMSQETCAAVAGIAGSTLSRYLDKGEAEEVGTYRTFYEKWRQVTAAPRIKAMMAIQNRWEEYPALAKWFLERQEPGFAPPAPQPPAGGPGPVTIQLAFVDGRVSGEGTVIDVPEVPAGPRGLSAAPATDRDKAS